MLPASHTPRATNRVKKQVVLELLSTVLSPAYANPQTLGSREHNLQSPTYCSLESHLDILRPERSMRITGQGSG